jgi:hypothetical protein
MELSFLIWALCELRIIGDDETELPPWHPAHPVNPDVLPQVGAATLPDPPAPLLWQ